MIGIIYNPTTNKGASVERMKKVREKLDEMGVEYDYRETEYAGHATELAKELAQTCDTIVSAGGDGTLHEILNGTVDLDINYAILPFGSGNDTSIALGTRDRTDEEHINAMVNGTPQLLDVMKLNDESISMQFGAYGIVPEVLSNFLKKKKSRGINYVLALLSALMRHKAKNYKVEVDGTTTEYFTDMVAIMNIQTAGGGLKICMDAKIDDRKLDLVVVKHVGFFRYWANVIALARGKILKQPNVVHQLVDSATMICDSVENCVVDGEMIAMQSCKMAVYSKQIKIKI